MFRIGRFRQSLLIAVALHALLLMALPSPQSDWMEPLPRRHTSRTLDIALHHPQPPQAIPIPLPRGELILATRLDPGRQNGTPRPALPDPVPFAKGTARLSASLQDAAREAAAAYRRQSPPPPSPARRLAFGDLPADLSLAPIASAQAADWLQASPSAPAAPKKPRRRPATPSAPPLQPPATTALPPSAPVPAPPAPDTPGAVAVVPPTPALGGPSAAPAAEPATVAIFTAPSPVAAPAMPSEPAGPPAESRIGAWTPDTDGFFTQLTAHLYDANQRALAEAIRAGPKQTVEVRFAIDRWGNVLDASVVHSSGNSRLDEAAVRTVLRASPLPRLAEEMPNKKLELRFPVEVYR